MTDTSNSPATDTRAPDGPEAPTGMSGIATARLAACVLIVFGFFPLVNWIAGGHEADWYDAVLGEWANGALIAIGGGVVLAILSRRLPLWRTGLLASLARGAHDHPARTGMLVGGGAFAVYCGIAIYVLSGRPLFIDEMSQLFQARIFAGGRLWLEAPRYREFTSIMHILDENGKWYSQFPPGGPLMMVPAVLLERTWLAGPMAGAVAAMAFWGIVRRLEPRGGIALGAAILYAASPFVAFLAGSHMNHVATAMWVLLAVYGLVRLDEAATARPGFAALCGVALGIAATIRPVDALAFALPAGLWMLWRAVRRPARWIEVAAAGAALAIPMAGVLWYNAQTTGDPLLFAYEKLWGVDHGLGFHRAPWGYMHSPARGLELVNLYLLRLQSYLFETPVPSLCFAVSALLLTRRVGRVDRYWLLSSALVLALYFAYWHDGFYLGPRFVYLIAPVLVLWTARLPSIVVERWPLATLWHRGVAFGMLTSAALAVASAIPFRAAQYARGLASTRLDYTDVARQAGVEGALIFVRESWGTQLLARMWRAGVSRSEAETFYRNIDACALDDVLTEIERAPHVAGDAVVSRIRPLLRDSARVVHSSLSPDATERMLPGARYGVRCQQRIIEDRAGFTLLAPLLAAEWGSNVYARDLHAHDSLMVQSHPGRPVYLMRPASADAGAPPRLEQLRVDSLFDAWRRSP